MNSRFWKKSFLVVLTLMMCASVFGAQSFTASAQIVDNRIFSDEVAEFSFRIQNLDVESDRFIIFTTDPSWNVYFKNSLVTLGEKETKVVSVLVDPTSTVLQGQIYSVPLIIKSLDDEEQVELVLDITLDSNEIRTYKPSIFIDVVVGNQNVVDPLEKVPVSVRLINKNALDIKDLSVELKSNLINDVFSVPLSPNGEVTKLLSYSLNPQTIPGDKYVDVVLSIDGQPVSVESRFVYTVSQSRPAFERSVLLDSDANGGLFLKSEYEVSLLNNGNIAQTEEVLYPLSWFEGFFTKSTEYDSTRVVDGKRYIVYDVTLEPGDQTSILITTNYRSFVLTTVIVLLLIFGSIFSYYFFRAPIIIKKRVLVLGEVSDGVSRLKVVLDIKNRTGKLLKDIRVIERAPTITDVEDDFSVGTLAPTKVIKNAMKGTLIRWDFNTIEPYEERLITYTIRSKLSILGELKLPSTIVKYERFGHTQTVKETVSDDDDED